MKTKREPAAACLLIPNEQNNKIPLIPLCFSLLCLFIENERRKRKEIKSGGWERIAGD